jgi:hypothetical protein
MITKTRWLRLRHIQRRTENLHNDGLWDAIACGGSFCPYGKPSRRVFIQAKNNKMRLFINISTARNGSYLKRAMKSSNRWNVLTSLDKTEEEIIKSFGVKQK